MYYANEFVSVRSDSTFLRIVNRSVSTRIISVIAHRDAAKFSRYEWDFILARCSYSPLSLSLSLRRFITKVLIEKIIFLNYR
jgi:hypothetical protein